MHYLAHAFRAPIVLTLMGLASCAHLALPPQDPPAAGWTFGVNSIVGGRFLDEDTYDPLEDQGAVGIELDMRPKDSPAGIEFGIAASGAREEIDVLGLDVDIESRIAEAYIGPRITIGTGDEGFFPYFGGGITFLYTDLEAESRNVIVDDDDETVGAYAHGGFYYQWASGLRAGLDVRGVFSTDVSLFGVDADSDYVQVGVLVGGAF